MKTKMVMSLLTSVLVSTACSKPNSIAPDSTRATTSAEHCFEANACFLEVQSEGKSTFFTAEDKYETLLLNPAIADMNIQLQKMDSKAYHASVKAKGAAKVVYNSSAPGSVDVYSDGKLDKNANFIGIIVKVLGYLFKGLNIAGTLGAIFGSDQNSATSVVNYHFGADTVKETVEVQIPH